MTRNDRVSRKTETMDEFVQEMTGGRMTTIVCYQCVLTCDLTEESRAIEQAHRHARDYGHNVGVYATESLGEGMKREVLAVVLKSRHRAA